MLVKDPKLRISWLALHESEYLTSNYERIRESKGGQELFEKLIHARAFYKMKGVNEQRILDIKSEINILFKGIFNNLKTEDDE